MRGETERRGRGEQTEEKRRTSYRGTETEGNRYRGRDREEETEGKR